MKKILFHSINSSWSHSCLALYYMAALIRDLPYKPVHLANTLKDDSLEVLNSVIAENPDLICYSVYIWNCSYIQKLLLPLLQLLPQVRIILGGPEVERINLEAQTEVQGRLSIIKGPGERSFKELALHQFEPGFEGNSPNYHLSELPFPYTKTDLQDLQGRLLYYESSRGCPYSCIYCLSARDHRSEMRFELGRRADCEKLSRELELMIRARPKTLKFVDRSFNTDKTLAHFIWNYLIQHPEPCPVHFEIYPDLLTESDIELLEHAPEGIFRFEIGIQSTDAKVLRRCGRTMDWAKAKRMLALLRKRTKVLCHCDLLIGLPGEGYNQVLHSIDEVMELQPHELQLGTLKILPDTSMQHLAHDLNYVWQTEAVYRVLQTDALSFEKLFRLDRMAHIINLYWNKGEERELWICALQKNQASVWFERLLDYHTSFGIQFHSVAASKRKEILHTVLDSATE